MKSTGSNFIFIPAFYLINWVMKALKNFGKITILKIRELVSLAHWTYFMQILSNYNTKSLYHIENSVIKALKSDIFHSYTCEINIGDIWLQFEKLKKLRQMALSYRNIKNKC